MPIREVYFRRQCRENRSGKTRFLTVLQEFAEYFSPDFRLITAVARSCIEQLIVAVLVILIEEERIEDQKFVFVSGVRASGDAVFCTELSNDLGKVFSIVADQTVHDFGMTAHGNS